MEDELEFVVVDKKTKTKLGVVHVPVRDIADSTEEHKVPPIPLLYHIFLNTLSFFLEKGIR